MSLHQKSTFHANKSVILGHISSGMGEKTHCLKLKWLLDCPLYDVFDFFKEYYEPLALMNYDLAESGYPLLEEISLPFAKEMRQQLAFSENLFILSWNFSAAATFAAGLHKNKRVIAKLYAHHENEKILPTLYEPADLLITESLLASRRAFAYGVKKEKVLFLPHYYPELCEKVTHSRKYVEDLALRLGKKISPKTRLIGTVSRLELGKNCEYALEAVRRLFLNGQDVVLVLKGDFPKDSPNLEYQKRLLKLLEEYDQEPWLLWDRNHTPFPDVLQEFAAFDVLLHPSGAEAGCHVIIECLGLGIPVILLDCSTNPYLFKGLATFVKTKGNLFPAQLPFFVPDIEDLVEKLEEPMFPPTRSEVRKRFHVEGTRERLHLLFEGNPKKIQKRYDEDCKVFQLT